MSVNHRVTPTMLDVLECLLWADREGRPTHGYAIMHTTMRTGATVYNVLDKLETLGWVTAEFELHNADNPTRPPRRLYQLTTDGTIQAEQLLNKRRPRRTTPPTFAPRSVLSRILIWTRPAIAR